jgi:hypothetical protein
MSTYYPILLLFCAIPTLLIVYLFFDKGHHIQKIASAMGYVLCGMFVSCLIFYENYSNYLLAVMIVLHIFATPAIVDTKPLYKLILLITIIFSVCLSLFFEWCIILTLITLVWYDCVKCPCKQVLFIPILQTISLIYYPNFTCFIYCLYTLPILPYRIKLLTLKF